MNSAAYQALLSYNAELKRVDDVYRRAVKRCGMGSCAFWILYTLRMEQRPHTQSEIRERLYAPKQTVNSALKKLEAEGYLSLAAGEDQRSKAVRLTEAGRGLAGSCVDWVVEAEARALEAMGQEDRETFLRLTRLYGTLLDEQLRAGDKEKQEEGEEA